MTTVHEANGDKTKLQIIIIIIIIIVKKDNLIHIYTTGFHRFYIDDNSFSLLC